MDGGTGGGPIGLNAEVIAPAKAIGAATTAMMGAATAAMPGNATPPKGFLSGASGGGGDLADCGSFCMSCVLLDPYPFVCCCGLGGSGSGSGSGDGDGALSCGGAC